MAQREIYGGNHLAKGWFAQKMQDVIEKDCNQNDTKKKLKNIASIMDMHHAPEISTMVIE